MKEREKDERRWVKVGGEQVWRLRVEWSGGAQIISPPVSTGLTPARLAPGNTTRRGSHSSPATGARLGATSGLVDLRRRRRPARHPLRLRDTHPRRLSSRRGTGVLSHDGHRPRIQSHSSPSRSSCLPRTAISRLHQVHDIPSCALIPP
ncbi:hypothetical protein BC628DRAFT_447760 [Trametes gibbosa]|nr:hypothetical protein BC628DRAFT_447760 [Trametes gibbosa]